MKHLESGRSFVEMLGVLAVMGIISIGGLYGYTYAMKRHRANELLNEANKRAVMVATQLMTGKDPKDVNIDEFPTNTPYGTFPTKITPKGSDKFSMSVSGLDEDTCQYMEELAGGAIRNIKCNENDGFSVEFTFNNDLSTEERASDYNGNKSGCEESREGYQYCESNETCIRQDEECPAPAISCDAYQGAGISDETIYIGGLAGLASDNETECRCKENEEYVDEKCTEVICSGHGRKENDVCICEDGYKGTNCETQYCLTNQDCTDPSSTIYSGQNTFCNVKGQTSGEISDGECLAKGSRSEMAHFSYNGKNFYATHPQMTVTWTTWWGNKNYCEAQGMESATLSDVPNSASEAWYYAIQYAVVKGQQISQSGDWLNGGFWLANEKNVTSGYNVWDHLERKPTSSNYKKDIHLALCKLSSVSCADYPGTGIADNITYTGGVAGKADDGISECRCPENQVYNGASCVSGKKVFRILSEKEGVTHPQARLECENLGEEYRLANLADLGYSAPASGKITTFLTQQTYENGGWQQYYYNLWLDDCKEYDFDCMNNPNGTTGYAYQISSTGGLTTNYRTDTWATPLCIKDVAN